MGYELVDEPESKISPPLPELPNILKLCPAVNGEPLTLLMTSVQPLKAIELWLGPKSCVPESSSVLAGAPGSTFNKVVEPGSNCTRPGNVPIPFRNMELVPMPSPP